MSMELKAVEKLIPSCIWSRGRHPLGLSLKVASPHGYSESQQKVWDGALWPSLDPGKIFEPIVADSIIRGLGINSP